MFFIPKNIRLAFLIAFTFSAITFTMAQGGMQLRKYITVLDSAKGVDELKKAEQNFVKLIADNKKIRQSLYYAALSNIFIAFECEVNEIDEYCTKADNYIKKLDSITPANSELEVLKAMNAGAKIRVDPKLRQTKFGAIANKFSEAALGLNNNNPRAHLIKAKTVMNAPAKIGGGPKFAIKHYEKAIEKYKTFKPLDDTEPDWGLAMAKKELQECKEKLKVK